MARMLLVAVGIQGAILLVGVLQILQLHFTGNYLCAAYRYTSAISCLPLLP